MIVYLNKYSVVNIETRRALRIATAATRRTGDRYAASQTDVIESLANEPRKPCTDDKATAAWELDDDGTFLNGVSFTSWSNQIESNRIRMRFNVRDTSKNKN